MAISIFKLVGSIMVDNAGANKSIDDTGKKADSLSDKFVSGVGTVAKWGAAVATAAGGAATALFGVATSAADSLDEIQKGAQQLGISYESYQKLSYACERSGTTIDKLSKGVKNITNVLGGMVDEDNKASEALTNLGVSITNADGSMRSSEEVMTDALYALADMEDATQRNAQANAIFGASYQDLAPLLNQGSEGIADLTQKCEDLGLVMSDDAVDAGASFQDQLSDIKDEFGAIVTQIGTNVMPIVQGVFDWIQEHMPTIQSVLGDVFQLLQDFLNWILPILDSIKTKVFDEIVPKIIAFVTSPEVQAFIDGLIQFFGDVYNWVVETLWPKVTEVAGGIWDTVKQIYNWAKDTAYPKIKEIAEWIWTKVQEIYDWIQENVIPKLKEVYDRIQEKLPEIKKAFDEFFKACDDALTAITNALDTIWKLLKEYVWPAVEMFIDSPYLNLWIEWIIDCLESVTKYIEGFSKILAVFKGDWGTAWDGAWTVISNFVINAMTTFNPLYQLIKGIVDMIKWLNEEDVEAKTLEITEENKSKYSALGISPKMATGGIISSAGTAIVGEAGAELIQMPRGATVTPLNDNNNAFSSMNNKLDELISVMRQYGQMGVYIDGNALVGEISAQMDTALGVRTRRAERGV